MNSSDLVAEVLKLPEARIHEVLDRILSELAAKKAPKAKADWVDELNRRHQSFLEGKNKSYSIDEAIEIVRQGRNGKKKAKAG